MKTCRKKIRAIHSVVVLCFLGLVLSALPANAAYLLTQGEITQTVEPIIGTTDVVSFYNYYSDSAHTPFVEDNVSKIYLYVDPNGNLSLVMHHSIDNSTCTNIRANFNLEGVPAGAFVAVSDDPKSWDYPAELSLDRDLEGSWVGARNADGGAIAGLPTDEGWCITVEPNFISGIVRWDFGTPTETKNLDMNEPVQICLNLLQEVSLDIKPGSCPNPLNVRSFGVLPAAVLGSEDFDVNTIDIASIRLAGVAPIRSGFEDVATPLRDANECECTPAGPDGFTDLTLKFKTQEIVHKLVEQSELFPDQVLPLTLDGVLLNGTPIVGTDCIVIRGRVPLAVLAKRADVNCDGKVDNFDFAMIAKYWLIPTAECD
ncbi:MAG TPA: hypothetical protein VMW16_08435 [Sedimentisphaerales bacterium]|nr:hypothetical protein [Sedimentisphaerales bacterium]